VLAQNSRYVWSLFYCEDSINFFFSQNVQTVVTDPGIPPWNKLRVVMLYALRYQKTHTTNIAALINLMLANGVSRDDAKVCSIYEFSKPSYQRFISACIRPFERRRRRSTTGRPIFYGIFACEGTFCSEGSQGSHCLNSHACFAYRAN
jgi:hypothetical protein